VDKFAREQPARLGCLLSPPTGAGLTTNGWTVWDFEHGYVAVHTDHEPRSTAGWVIVDAAVPPAVPTRTIHTQWHVENTYDWYRLHAHAAEGGPSELLIDGDPDNPSAHSDGVKDLCFDRPKSCAENSATTFELRFDGCDKKWSINFWIKLFSHAECDESIFPAHHVTVAPPPAESFSCDYERHAVDDPSNGQATVFSTACGADYGAFIYVYQAGCQPEVGCPKGVEDYGFTIAAPASAFARPGEEGAGLAQFTRMIDRSISENQREGLWQLGEPATVDVPYGPGKSHAVRFRWMVHHTREWSIVGDTGPAGPLVSALTLGVNDWPLAAGSISDAGGALPGVPPGKAAGIIEGSSTGCFTVRGVPGSAEPNALVVDLSPIAKGKTDPPRVENIDSSRIPDACG
jgi:hypothetical protein